MLAPNTEINALLKVDAAPKRFAWLRGLAAWIVVLVVIAAAGLWRWSSATSQATITYKTTAAKRGDIAVTVSATGTVEPINEVDISSELSGTIAKVNVDFNDIITAGEVLAVINTDNLIAQANSVRADLEAAKAAVTRPKRPGREASLRDRFGTTVAAVEAAELIGRATVFLIEINAPQPDWTEFAWELFTGGL